jgi:hypothetical protein
MPCAGRGAVDRFASVPNSFVDLSFVRMLERRLNVRQTFSSRPFPVKQRGTTHTQVLHHMTHGTSVKLNCSFLKHVKGRHAVGYPCKFSFCRATLARIRYGEGLPRAPARFLQSLD